MKKLLLLGGSRYIVPVIDTAHKLGVYVITCDYLPDNIAHQKSDEYWNISIVDKNAVLDAARERQIDGIMSFACDPGVLTAAYVAEEMGLPFQCSYKSTQILQDKGLFRQFLKDYQFNTPMSKRFQNQNLSIEDLEDFTWPIIVKPVDSAGSKGVTKVDRIEDLQTAVEHALKYSNCGAFIIEEFLVFEGYHSSADLFTIDGKLEFVTYSDQLFDANADNPYTPAYIIWPSTMRKQYQEILTSEIQRLMTLLEVRNGIYNVETCVSNGKPYIMEVSPRGGGCKIAELQNLAFGLDLIEREIRAALGMPIEPIGKVECKGNWCEMVVHLDTNQGGYLEQIKVESEVQEKYVRVQDFSVVKGGYVAPFTGANMALGDMFLEFDSRERLDSIMQASKEWLQIVLAEK